MKKQVGRRLGIEHVRDVLRRFTAHEMGATEASESLGMSRSGFYKLVTSYLKGKATLGAEKWSPGTSGGNHHEPWPAEVLEFLREAISEYGYSYAFAASEALRKYGKTVTRSQVRHWAITTGVAKAKRRKLPPAHARRWQSDCIGEIWQMDATKEPWFGKDGPYATVIDMVDDHSRVQVACTMYAHEYLESYIHLFRAAFMEYGLPLRIYVDRATVFRTQDQKDLTELAERLRYYGISFIYANSPEAKGKVERIHEVWQDRLPCYFRMNGITPETPLEEVNAQMRQLRLHRNAHETHRDIGAIPDEAWRKAVSEGRSKLRPWKPDPWWEYIWSRWHGVFVGVRGVVKWGNYDFPTQYRRGTLLWLCEHTDGTFTILANKPLVSKDLPQVVFTNRIRNA